MIWGIGWFTCGLIALAIGQRKGEGFISLLVGWLLGPLGILIALISSGNRIPCPFCKEKIHEKASICPHCRQELGGEETKRGGLSHLMTKGITMGVFILIILGVIAAVVAAGSGTPTSKVDPAETRTTATPPSESSSPDKRNDLTWAPWQFYSDVKGSPLCSIVSTQKVKDKNNGRGVIIKKFENSEAIDVSVFKEGWGLPNGTSVKVTYNFSDNEPLTLTARSEDGFLNMRVPSEYFAIFMLEIAQKSPMRISFPQDDSEPTWVVDAESPREAVMQFNDCVMHPKSSSVHDNLMGLPVYDVNGSCSRMKANSRLPDADRDVQNLCVHKEQQSYDYPHYPTPEAALTG